MLCFVVVMQSFIMNSHEVFIHIHQGCFAGTGAIVRLPQCQWSKPDGYRKISQCITTTKHSKAKTVCIFLGIYCISRPSCAFTVVTGIHVFINSLPASNALIRIWRYHMEHTIGALISQSNITRYRVHRSNDWRNLNKISYSQEPHHISL